MKRNEYIDCVKGIGILCVYLGHLVAYGSPLFRVIFNFHMPLFFFVSGCFFKPEEEKKRYFGRMAVNIGIPILFFTAIAGVVSIFCPGAEIPHEDTYPYWLIYLVSTWHSGPVFVSSLWFLLCLAGTQSVAWLICPWCRKSNSRVVVACLTCIALAGGISRLDLHFKYLFPLHASSIPMALVFYYGGYLCRKMIMQISQAAIRSSVASVAVVGLTLEFFFAVVVCKESPNLAVPIFPSLWTFAIASTTGIISVFLLAKTLSFKPLVFMGRFSLYLYMTETYARHVAYSVLCVVDSTLPDRLDVVSLSKWHIGFILILALICASCFAWVLSPALVFIQRRIRDWGAGRRSRVSFTTQSYSS